MPSAARLMMLAAAALVGSASSTNAASAALQRAAAGTAETVKIEPWGANSLRVRVALGGHTIHDGVGALIPPGSDRHRP
jgi:hypothetical protein